MKTPIRLMMKLWFVAIATLLAYTANAAGELSAPEIVQVAEQFYAAWLGDRTAGDKIRIARPDTAAADSVVERDMPDANTVMIQAPLEIGTYELRYVSGNSIIDSQPLEVVGDIRVDTGSGSSSGTSSRSVVREPADDEYTYADVLLLRGYQLGSERAVGEAAENRRKWCRDWGNARPALSQAGHMTESAYRQGMSDIDPSLASLLMRAEGALNLAGIEIFEDFQQHLGTVEEALCDESDGSYFNHFTITYAYCRMTMDTPTHSMDIHMPPSSAAALMQAVDYSTEEAMQIDLARDMQGTLPVTGVGWSSGIAMSPTGDSKEIIGHTTDHYIYQYQAGMGGAGTAPGMDIIASSISVQNSGTAWVAPSIEGDSIPRRFYWNLATQVQPAEGMAGYFSGLIMNIVGLLQHGLPLEVESTVASRIAGASVMKADSKSVITSYDLVPMPAGWCARSIVPPNFEVTNVSEQLDEMMAQQNSPEMQQAQADMEAAYAQMSPEERAMMESMGLSGLMGAGAAAAQSGSGRPPQAPAASAPTGSSMSLAKALKGDNNTQTVQNYLQALGYDTGDANGEMSLDTTIAISQFQAEYGMDATGEITPQLIGILAAKVDAL
jgi:hypothetical protein